MSFFRQLANKTKTFFGRTLPKETARWGRQLSRGSNVVGNALDKGSRFISKLERGVGGVPIVGDVLRLTNKGLNIGKNISDMAGISGRGLTALSNKDWNGAYQASKDLYREGKDTAQLGSGALADAAPLFI